MRNINWMVGFEYDNGAVEPIDVQAPTAFDAVEMACAIAEEELESGWTVGTVLDCGWAA